MSALPSIGLGDCLAVHFVASKRCPQQILVEQSLEYLAEMQFRPNRSYAGKSRWTKFSLSRENSSDGVELLCLDEIYVKKFGIDVSHWIACCKLRDSSPSIFFLGVRHPVRLPEHIIIRSIRDLISLGYIVYYAYRFIRDLRFHPYIYACGSGGFVLDVKGREINNEEKARIRAWGDTTFAVTRDPNETRFIRDIYEDQYVNGDTLAIVLSDGSTFQDWINSEGYRGTLTQILDNLYRWQVARDNVEAVYLALRSEPVFPKLLPSHGSLLY